MQLLRILRAHIALIAWAVALAWLAATAWTLTTKPKYVATSSLLVHFADDTTIGAKPPVQLYTGYLATQIDLLRSQAIALKVVDQLNLVDAAARARFFGDESPGARLSSVLKSRLRALLPGSDASAPESNESPDSRFWLADQLLKRVDVRPSPDSSVIQVSYSAPSAQAAAQAANAFVQSYIATTLEFNVIPARASSEWLDSQTRRLTADADTARRKLADFQQRTGIVGTGDANDVDAARLNDLNSQLVAAQSHNHPAIQALKSDLARAQAKLNELPPQLGPNHPSFQRARTEVNALRAQLEADTERLTAGLREEISKQRGAMLHMKQKHGQLAALQEEVSIAQRALDDAMEKSNEVRMQSQATQTNVSVVRVAAPPRQPTTPNPLFNFSLATLIGFVLGIGISLWREVVCRFVRSADDIRDFLGLQVLGVLHGGPRSTSGRTRQGVPLLAMER